MTEPMNPAEIAAMVARLHQAKNTTLRIGSLWHLCSASADMLEALQSQLSAMTEARDAAVAQVGELTNPQPASFACECGFDMPCMSPDCKSPLLSKEPKT